MSPVSARYPVRTASRIPNRSVMAAGDCLFLQRRVGNRVVRSLISAANPELRLAAAIDDDLHLHAPIFTSSDQFARLDNAFHNRPTLTAADNGPAVRVFQEALVAAGERLPKSTKPDGQLDGIWGNEMTAVVARFQAANGIEPGGFEAGRKTLLALDTHLKSVQPKPPGPQPQPKPSPTPTPPQDNQELETVMNQISIACQLLITRERDGLLALCRDLSGLDKPQPSALLVTAATLLQILAPPLYGFAEGALRIAIKKALNTALNPADEVLTDLDNMNDKVCDGIFASFSDAVSGLKQPSPDETRADLLADYCDAQLDQVTKAGFKAVSQFEDAGKTAIRNSKPSAQKHDPRNRSGDPRIDGALAVRDAVNQTADAAFAVRYDRALHAWDTQLA
ncbi:MAG TPA: peptidoglycan-binding domain-containing protein, partial [Bryobacteraceae bacterium]|nr:peptidoglycan-binding domain-containing protein [Bryobacteraceae bacterium]